MSLIYLIYCLFGEDTKYKSELIYSLMSLKKVSNKDTLSNVKIIIYTDKSFILPDQLNPLNISFSIIEKEVIINWINAANKHFYVIKPMVLLEFQKKFNAPCMLLDTDTFFIKNPSVLFEKISNGAFITHGDEFPISSCIDLVNFFSGKTFTNLEGQTFSINCNFYMLNAGVIGFHPEYSYILEKVVNLISQIAGSKDWPADWSHVIEQISFSYFIQYFNLRKASADFTIMHYWFFKECRYILANKFQFVYGLEEGIILKRAIRTSYDLLPLFIIRTMKTNSMITPLHFLCYPPHTLVGRLIRNAYKD
ncbi:MAG: hypothetical protein JWR50_2069 [Mucilaginibacter sp.]|nr:hypothetical protein [Mucilaginibacter sp.]